MLAFLMLSIIVHGGAGTGDDDRREACVAGCTRAAQAGYAELERGGTALDAVEAAVRVLEADPEFNAGYGATLNRRGEVEVDASVMFADPDGKQAGRCGAVAAVPWMRHPVTLARRVLEDGEHVLLAADGAVAFAREMGIAIEGPETMISERARRRYAEAKLAPPPQKRSGDTVGACAVDGAGRVAAATSTGGILYKRAGRVGDSPLIGAGCFADGRGGAASTTGHGESIIRVVMAKSATDRMCAGEAPEAAARASIAELVERTGGDAGIILVGRDGRLGHFTSTPTMPWASVSSGSGGPVHAGGVHNAGA